MITGQNEREETAQNTTVTKSAACASARARQWSPLSEIPAKSPAHKNSCLLSRVATPQTARKALWETSFEADVHPTSFW